MTKEPERRYAFLTRRRLAPMVAAGVLAVMAGCSGGSDGDTSARASTGTGAAPAPSTSKSVGSGKTPVQLDVDPCTLLTMTEIEAAIGSGVERGGFGEDLPGRCTYSIGGDVGAGVVAVRVEDPLECGVVLQALAADSLDGTTAVRVDVGDGGVYVKDADVQFSIGGGCVGVGGSTSGENLGQDKLVALARAAAGRVG